MRKVCGKLIDIFLVLSSCKKLQYIEHGVVRIAIPLKQLLTITPSDIVTPAPEISDSVFYGQNDLPETFVPKKNFQALVNLLKPSITGLDHIGFCYTVRSQEKELVRIQEAMRDTDFHLYEMTSNDLAKWYFIGDARHWKEPLVELLPTLPNDDPELPYWMPHIHIDIETTLGYAEIENNMKKIFPESRPIKFSDPTYGVYNVRLRLGKVGGVNVMFDIGTNVTNLRWVRKHMLIELNRN